jgi:hypothetical protein
MRRPNGFKSTTYDVKVYCPAPEKKVSNIDGKKFSTAQSVYM